MMVVCLWSPGWSTGGASDAEPGPRPADLALSLAELAPRIRVESEVVWADARGLDAVALATRLLGRLSELGVEGARAGVAAIPVTAELAARSAPASLQGGKVTPFLVKDRTGWGWRTSTPHAAGGGSPSSSSVPAAGRESAPGPGGGRAGMGRSGDGAAAESGAVSPHPPLPGEDRKGPESGLRPERKRGDEAGSPYRSGAAGVVAVRKGEEATWQAPLPISAMAGDDRLRALLEGVGVTTLGALAGLEREAVEVRFGPAAVALWRLARAEDRRILFRRVPPERPCGSIDFVDYVLTDPARLLFTANALLGPLCDRLVARGEHARAMRLVLPLADGSEWDRVIRPARPTASRDAWLRLLRNLLERLTVPDAVAGMRLEVGRTEPAAVRQGDLFDRGFATAAAVEAAVARLAERQVRPLAPKTDAHPLLERRGHWRAVPPDALTAPAASPAAAAPSVGREDGEGREGLTLQLLATPRPVRVDAVRRRDHHVPVRLRDRGGWREIAHAAGPDRISGGQWEAEAYAREYFRCVTDDGVLLWIYRDAREGGWFLHGWWD